jgi:hypothetical protein
MLKAALLVVVVVAVSLVPVTSSGAAGQSCSAVPRHAARLTIKALKIFNRPIRTNPCGTASGPIWDPFHPARPGDGESMVIDAHDVTPVKGYDTHGQHGPFYHLYRIKPGYTAKIKWHGVVSHYRFVKYPFAARQCLSKRVNDLPARLAGELMCVENDKPIKSFRTEVVYFRCCWPRYTRKDFLYVRAVLVKPKSQEP